MSRLPADLTRGLRQAQIMGGGMALAIAIYALVIEMIRTQRAPFGGFAPDVPLTLLRFAFVLMGVLCFVVVRMVRASIVAGRTRPVAPAGGLTPLVHRLLTASVVTLGICESIAVYGLVLFLLGGHRSDFYGFAALSVAAFAVNFPRLSQWEAWAQQA